MKQIDRQTAEALYQAYEHALAALSEAQSLLWQLPEHPDKRALIDVHGDAWIKIQCTLRAPLLAQFPDLNTERPEGPPDTELDEEEQADVDALTADDIARIDEALLAQCDWSWRKVAMLVGRLLSKSAEVPDFVPVGYVAQRVQALVAAGRLESQGNLDYIRFSEVRLFDPRSAGAEK